MLTDLPRDVLERILSFVQHASTPARFARLALVSPVLRPLVDQFLFRYLDFSTSGGVRAFLEKVEDGTQPAGDARTLILRRSDVEAQTGRGSRRRGAQANESCSDEDLLRLCSICVGLEELRLEGPAFTTLKRRQFGFASNLSSLRILSIAGNGAGFNLHTIGQVLQDLPQLEELDLKRIQAFPAALKALPRPLCRLRRFTLHSSPAVSPQQLGWLLSASIEADSLRHLDFNIADIPPSRLGGLRWAATPVQHLCLSFSNTHAVEKLAQHFPSLTTFAFATSGHPDAFKLLSSCGTSATFEELVDRSDSEGGLHSLELASALLYLRRRGQLASLRRIVLPLQRRLDPAFPVLAEVCTALGIGCDTMHFAASPFD
ncbi:hypothetical protein JCM10296v2_005226 [Rhodotorula toruloides]